ncbi:MAG: ABC transporter permease [Alphaproteobacteria bacterium]|nr:ABC transporter permease [Alphaproteobacteria bacterium]
MSINDIFKESWLSISGNKVRSFLTILGIIIGVMAVVIMMSVGDAVQKQVTGQFAALGTNTIMIRAGASQTSGVRTMSGMNTLTIQDAEALGQLPDVEYITPIRSTSGTLIFGNRNWGASALASYPTYQQIQNIEMEHGTFFDMSAVRNASTHVVVGPTVAKELELGDNPVGQVIRMNGVPLVVIGVTREKGGAGFSNTDDMIFLPITTLQKRIQNSRFPNSVPQIVLRLNANADNALAVEQITQLLRERHRLRDTDRDDFQITDMKQVMETMNTVTGFLRMLLMAIASVSLLVGSIGIMNMMLVSVAERTREIGIRKAIGARESHITIQFLSESVLISFMGSMLGFILGVVLSQTLLPKVMDMAVPLNIWSVFLSIGVAGVVGIASGVMPARKAAKLNPIDALRYE